ncbi:MAG: bifunctional folylpolyglutamate synthase/dihydrofolate synthase [Gemmatimonadetes bacterium]|nr:bifunctional folylpolyglutamate synthase/dihydrofolate synthase [Gemmatimonadota bacterium]
MTLAFEEACRFLSPRTFAGKPWSLEPTRTLLAELGNPEREYAIVHIGGTNGKGSVSAMTYAALREAGVSVGLYTSPHLVDVRERMVVDGRPISREAFAAWTERLRPLIERSGASFFEGLTAIALADLAARRVEVAVVEVGLGGRLDSTNVVEPVASAVTTIAREHTEYLGDTLPGIAREKAGIAKPGTPFVIGETDPAIATVLADVAGERGARPIVAVPPGAEYAGPLGLRGSHQRRNAAIAAALLDVLPDPWRPGAAALAAGFSEARLAGRFDRRGRWIFDVAHNPAGIGVLVGALRETELRRPVHALVGILGDKAWQDMLAGLAEVVDRIWLTTPPTAPPERRWNLDEVGRVIGRWSAGGSRSLRLLDSPPIPAPGSLAARLPPASIRPITRAPVIEPDFDRALQQVQQGAATVLVTGSFHTVGDALARLPGFAPLG